jgi:hypothetical protein
MINKRIIIYLLLLTTLLTTACFQPKLAVEKARGFICASLPAHDEPVENTRDDLAIAWQHNIDLLRHVYKSQVIPEHLKTEQPVFRGAEFNIMRIFEFLDHLSMLPGYQLAYSYYYQSSFAGNPTLYACEAPFYGTPDSTNCHRNHLYYVVTDGSELGYLQFILLYVMGDQFYIYWHADYGKDKLLVATDEALSKILLRIEDDLDEQQKAQAGLIDPQPRVLIGEDTVTIRVVWFTKFGGFFETTYQVNKDQPHTTKMLETNSLLEYDCGIMY